jgi:hypothetical protein
MEKTNVRHGQTLVDRQREAFGRRVLNIIASVALRREVGVADAPANQRGSSRV